MDAHRLVVVETDDWLLELLADGLREAGFVVTSATRASDGLQKVLESLPDCVISAANLPGRDGHWLVEEIRFYEETSITPVVLIVPEGDEAARKRALEAGADALITRPFLLSEVVAQVHALIEFAKRMRERRTSLIDGLRAPPASGESAGFQGDLEHMPVASLLALLELEKKSGVVDARTEGHHARFELAGGLVASSEIDGNELDLAEALSQTTSWNSGRIVFRAMASPPKPGAARSVRALLAVMRNPGLLSKAPIAPPRPPPPARPAVSPLLVNKVETLENPTMRRNVPPVPRPRPRR